MLMTCLDYKETPNPLTATEDGANFMTLLNACGVTDVTYMENLQCSAAAVKDAIEDVASRCDEDDLFIYFYAGHGTSVPDKDGDEDDGKDEALCFVNGETGQVSLKTVMIDDDFADTVQACLNPATQMLIITDCCHSGTIADLTGQDWNGFKVVAIAGCTDEQTSGDTGRGGICTHSLLMAVQDFADEGEDAPCVAEVYNHTLTHDDETFHSEQIISISSSPGFTPNEMCWPLVPPAGYVAPFNA